MSPHQRQFSQERIRATSRTHSQIAHSTHKTLHSSLYSPQLFQHSCLSCINKTLAQSKLLSQKQTQKEEKAWQLHTIHKINSMNDLQKQYRQKKLLEATQFNKTMLSSQKQSLKQFKSHQDTETLKLIQNQLKYIQSKQKSYQQSQIQLNSNYQHDLKKQLQEQKQKRASESLTLKSEDPFKVNNLKIIEENQKYVKKAHQEMKNCQRQNQKLIFKKSLAKHEEKQKSLKEDQQHLQTIETQFKSFTQFLPGKSSSLSFCETLCLGQNPEIVFDNLKRIENNKKLSKITQRLKNKEQRALELKRIEEQNRRNIKKKIQSMKSYVQDLKNQILDKRKRETDEDNYRKNFEPKKSRVDYFTEEIKNEVSQCQSCEKVVQKKYFGI